MKKVWLLVLLVFCVGCVTVKIPKYLKDEFPYEKRFYAKFDETLNATIQALDDLHWKVTNTSHPSVFEEGVQDDQSKEQILIFTEVRQTPLFLSSKYMSLNVYVIAADDNTDVEIRYVSVMPVFFKHAYNYKNDFVVNKVFDRIAELLEK